MRKSLDHIQMALKSSAEAAPGMKETISRKESRDGWLSPDYQESIQAKINISVAEANRCMCLQSDSEAMEYYKVLRAQIQQRMVQNNWSTLMITSPHEGEGKTLTAINLALTMAREFSQTVLLVDADLRTQTVHKYLGYMHPRGLTEYLEGDMPLSDVIVWPGVEKMTVISGGRTVQGSTEMLTSPRMKALVSEMKNRYEDRYVLFDVPPVLNCSEAISFAHMVDAILLIVEEGRTTLEDVQRAINILPEEKLLGVALNRHQFEMKKRNDINCNNPSCRVVSKIGGMFSSRRRESDYKKRRPADCAD